MIPKLWESAFHVELPFNVPVRFPRGEFSFSNVLEKLNVRLPQVGEFSKRDPIEDPNAPFVTTEFTGNAVAVSAKTRMIDQISLRPYLGRSFRRGFVYVGGGPTVSYMRTEIQDLVGFADINHRATEIPVRPRILWIPVGCGAVPLRSASPIFSVDLGF